MSWDHPRVRGEKLTSPAGKAANEGSPPRARGKVPHLFYLMVVGGITPACAGKSKLAIAIAPILQDHPRVRGEKLILKLMVLPILGSPPRARGKDAQTQRKYRRMRITPACAGKSFCSNVVYKCAWDHPRVRGEKFRLCLSAMMVIGSPPRARGKDAKSKRKYRRMGITPACAGKSPRYIYGLDTHMDHPRVRGEKKIPVLGIE